jgi:putative transposase
LRPVFLHVGPVERPPDWPAFVNQTLTTDELLAVRTSATRNRPYGSIPWMQATAQRLGLEASLRPRGRPRQRPAPAQSDDTLVHP